MNDSTEKETPKVVPKPVAALTALPRTGWLQDIGYFDDETSAFMRVLLYGAMGTGKTTLAATFPSPLFIDLDKGGMTVRKKHIPHVRCYDSKGIIKKVFAILEAAHAKSGPFAPGEPFGEIKTIVFDSMSVFSNSALVDLIAQTGRDPLDVKAGYDEYGRLLNIQIALGKLFKALSSQYNVIVTALPTIDKDENTGSIVGGPSLVGQYRGLIGADFDEVYYLMSEGTKDNVKHVLFTSKQSFYDAKSRLGGMPYKLENPTYDSIKKYL